MDEHNAAFLLGAGAGAGTVAVQQFVFAVAAPSFGAPPSTAVLRNGLLALLTVAVVPGAVAVGAHRLAAGPRRVPVSRVRLAAVVGAGTGVAVVAARVLRASQSAEGLYVTPWSVGSSVVSALPPSANAAVAALAGFLLADRKR